MDLYRVILPSGETFAQTLTGATSFPLTTANILADMYHGETVKVEVMTEISWALTEPIDVTQVDETYFLLARINGPGAFVMSEQFGEWMINGNRTDLGDDFMTFMSILDVYLESEPNYGVTLRQEPYKDEES